jgi:hypothetical protein
MQHLLAFYNPLRDALSYAKTLRHSMSGKAGGDIYIRALR